MRNKPRNQYMAEFKDQKITKYPKIQKTPEYPKTQRYQEIQDYQKYQKHLIQKIKKGDKKAYKIKSQLTSQKSNLASQQTKSQNHSQRNI